MKPPRRRPCPCLPPGVLRSFGALVAIAALAGLAGCGGEDRPAAGDAAGDAGSPAAEEGGAAAAPADAAPADAASPEASPARVALPGLFTIMAGLERDAAGVSRGLWQEDFDSIAAAAAAIADHPRVPPEEREAIAGVLGPDMGRFGALDMAVHDLAVRLRERALERDLEGTLQTDAELRQGCITCHTEFRERLREGIR